MRILLLKSPFSTYLSNTWAKKVLIWCAILDQEDYMEEDKWILFFTSPLSIYLSNTWAKKILIWWAILDQEDKMEAEKFWVGFLGQILSPIPSWNRVFFFFSFFLSFPIELLSGPTLSFFHPHLKSYWKQMLKECNPIHSNTDFKHL